LTKRLILFPYAECQLAPSFKILV